MVNLISWCDENISLLKANGISFEGGLAHLPQDAVYNDIPYCIVPFRYRNDIPVDHKKDALLAFFTADTDLFPRLERIDDDIKILTEYGGMCGFDMSPCIGMLRPRQQMSLLISSIYNCRCALAGIKIVPNARVGDLGTICLVSASIPQCSMIVTGELGCRQKKLKSYGLYQLGQIIQEHKPEKVLVYGGFSITEASQCAANIHPQFLVYPGRRSRMRNHKKPYQIVFYGNHYEKVPFDVNGSEGGAA